MKLKILSYNIHKGYDWKKQNYFLEDMRKMINSSHADIVFLQEVVGQNNFYKEKGLVDAQFEFLADTVWKHYSYAKNSLYDHGHHGNLILSRYPIEAWENIDLTTNFLEKRGLLVCKILLPESKTKYIHAACAHLDLFHTGRRRQYELIKDKIKTLDSNELSPLILAGDFNDWNQQSCRIFEEEMKMQEAYKAKHGRLAKTFPAGLPLFCLDRIYVRNMKINDSYIVKRAEHQDHFSDHLPIYCEVEIEEEKS